MKTIKSENLKRILVTRIDRMGDVLLTTPVLEALRKRFPNAWISVLVAPQNQVLVEGNPFINEVLVYDKKRAHRSWIQTFLFSQELKKKQFDLVIHFHSTNRMMLLTFLAGIRYRLGWIRRLPWLLTHALPDTKKRGEKHEAEYNFDLVEMLGVEKPKQIIPFFPLQEKDKMTLDSKIRTILGKKIMVIHAGASCPSKRWPTERFAKIAQTLHHHNNFQVVLVGGNETKEISEEIVQQFPLALDLTAKLSLGELAQLLKMSAFLLSNDSGPAHLASAVGCPVISIFGRKDAGLSPVRWRPLGEKSFYLWKDVGCELCLAHDCQIDFLCLTEISVDEVRQTIESKILNQTVKS